MKQLKNIIGTIGLAAIIAGCDSNPCQEGRFTLRWDVDPVVRHTGKINDTYCYKGKEVRQSAYEHIMKCPGRELQTDMAAMDCLFEYYASGQGN